MKSFDILIAIIGLIVIGGAFYIARPNGNSISSTSNSTPTPTPEQQNAQPPQANQPAAPAHTIQPNPHTMRVSLQTTKGEIILELSGIDAPLTVGNFVKLAQDGFYDGTSFHRVIPEFMVQGGDPLSKDQNNRGVHGTGGPGYMFEDEINSRRLVRGSVAMANSGPNTNGSQFFIVTAEATPWLDGKHTNFGRVVEGMEVVDAIEAVETDARDNPIEPVVIESVQVFE